jgi:hypothetical protein
MVQPQTWRKDMLNSREGRKGGGRHGATFLGETDVHGEIESGACLELHGQPPGEG